MSRSRGTAAAAVLIAGLLAGCGGDGGLDTAARADRPSSSSPGTASASSAPASPTATSDASEPTEEAAAAAVRRDFDSYVAAYLKALRSRNDRIPDLVRYSTARRHAEDRASISRMRQHDVVFRGDPRFRFGKLAVSANRATLRVCEYDSSARFVYSDSGELAEQVRDAWEPYLARLVLRDGRWQVDQYRQVDFSCKGAR
jgi:hypothetical protein